MEHANITTQTSCLSLTEAANDAIGALHFRMLCDSSVVERRLFDSLTRCWKELTTYFPEESISLDMDNVFNASVYPFLTSGEVTVWERWEPTIFKYGSVVTGDESLPEDEFGAREKVSELIAKIYREQFVFRLSIFVTDDIEQPRTTQEMLHNFLLNADVPGVRLLSAEQEGVAQKLFPLDQILPENNETFTRQPIVGSEKTTEMTSLWRGLGVTKSNFLDKIEHSHSVYLTFLGKDSSSNYQVSTTLPVSHSQNNFNSIKMVASYPVAESGLSHPTLVGSVNNSVSWPLWLLGLKDGELTMLRSVYLPCLQSVQELFDVVRSYPARAQFEERYGLEYMLLLAESNIPVLPSLVAAGFFIERDVTPDGYVCFFAGLMPEEEGEPTLMFEGTERQIEDYLEKLITACLENNSVFSLNEALSIAQEMGCSPGSLDNIKNEHYFSQ